MVLTVLYFTSAAENQPVRDYLDGLPNKVREDVVAALEDLATRGLEGAAVDLKHVEGKLWEIRVAQQRVFYVVIDGPTMVLLHANKKQSQKARKKDLDVSRTRMSLILDWEKQQRSKK
jgi:phage-related protein